MKKPTTALALSLTLLCCASPNNNGGQGTGGHGTGAQQKNADVAELLADAERLIKDRKFDEALTITDELLRENPGLRPARILAGKGSLGLVPLGRSNTRELIQDAIGDFKRALSANANDPDTWMLLSGALLMDGRFVDGRDAALQAAARYKKSRADNAKVASALLKAADNEMHVLADARREEYAQGVRNPSPETVAKAQVVLSRLKKAEELGAAGPAYEKASTVYEVLGRTLEAINQVERGIAVAPDSFDLHTKFRKLHGNMGREAEMVASYKAMIRNHGEQPGLLCGHGIAQVVLADKQRRGRKFDQAVRHYQDAAKGFGNAARLRTDWRSFCGHYQAICHISLANIAIEREDLAAAKSNLLAASKATPRIIDNDANGRPVILDSFYKSYLGTVNQLGNTIVGDKSPTRLQAALDYWEEFLALHPDRFGWMYNNAALNARDLGAAFQKRATTEDKKPAEATMQKAMAFWERSYELYSKAADLSPDDARIVNDCGLMLVYHLKRDYDKARKMFDHAIVVGKKQLTEMPADTPQSERELLEEAVGDAYQNIAVMLQNLGKPFAEYKPFLQDAIKYYPYRGREAQRMLRLGGGRRDGGQAKKPDIRKQLFADAMKIARPKADNKDWDGALLELDKSSKRLTGHAPFHYAVGLYSLRYAQKAATSGGSAAQIDGLLGEARFHLQEAVKLDGEPIEPRVCLAQAYAESGDFETSAKVAESNLSHIASRGGSSDDMRVATLRLRAMSGARVYIKARREQKDNAAELQASRIAFRSLEKRGKLDDESRKVWSTLEQWAGDKTAAIAVYARSITGQPAQAALQKLVDVAKQTGEPEQAVDVLRKNKDALSQWYLGVANYEVGHKHAKNDATRSIEAYDAAIQAFSSATGKAAFKDSSLIWTAICLGEKAYLQLGAGKEDAALASFVKAARTRPARAAATLSNGRTIVQGFFVLAEPYTKKEDWENAERIMRAAGEVLPDNASIANNHGLFARNWGVKLEELGRRAEAKSFYEAGYKSYQRATRIEPETLRLQNDVALMLVYHLKRDIPWAKKTLESCIAKGTKILKENPPEDEAARREIEETVGDCHQNLGYCLMTIDKNLAAAKTHLQKSLEFYPYKERKSIALLEQIKKAGK